jgi:YbgC/YbaW family acyl-CoA thioester hydrolase
MRERGRAVHEPATPVFETLIRVRFHEVDGLGHVNNAAYLNYLEQAAIDHAAFVGLNMERLRAWGGVFVARRHEIDFLRPAYAGDTLQILTWLAVPVGARVERQYRIFRQETIPGRISPGGRVLPYAATMTSGEPIVTALTEWVFASEAGRPRRIPPEVITAFTAYDGLE